MPYTIQKVRNRKTWNLVNVNTKQIHTKCKSLKHAKHKLRQLESLHGNGLIESVKSVGGSLALKLLNHLLLNDMKKAYNKKNG